MGYDSLNNQDKRNLMDVFGVLSTAFKETLEENHGESIDGRDEQLRGFLVKIAGWG